MFWFCESCFSFYACYFFCVDVAFSSICVFDRALSDFYFILFVWNFWIILHHIACLCISFCHYRSMFLFGLFHSFCLPKVNLPFWCKIVCFTALPNILFSFSLTDVWISFFLKLFVFLIVSKQNLSVSSFLKLCLA